VNEPTFVMKQLRRMKEGRAWHGPSLDEALTGVTFELAERRVAPGSPSIYDLTHHVGAWAGELLARIRGRAAQLPDEGDWPADPPTRERWEAARARLDEAHAALLREILSLDQARLAERVASSDDPALGGGTTVLGMLHGLVQHDAYHAGQIVLIRRALGG
jgi:uncharacterized damage-inducible protein DinB